MSLRVEIPAWRVFGRALPYALAVCAVLLTTLLRLALGEWLTDPALLFLGAVALVAWRAGAVPGCFAVAVSALAQARYFIAPDSFLLASYREAIELVIWSAEAVLVCALFGALRRANRRSAATAGALAANQLALADREQRLRAAHDHLERQVETRTAQLARANEDLRLEIADRERTGEQLRQSQKMEAVGRLAGGVAHDFNNMLCVVLSLTALNLDEATPGTGLHDDLREIQKAARRATDLTRQLLTFSRQQIVEARVVDAHDSVTEMEKMLRQLVGESVFLSLAKERPVGHVCIDPGSLGQVVMNLVVNARDAMPRGGRIAIRLSDAVLDASHAHLGAKPGPHVLVEVVDTGEGMDEATMTRIFEPFFSTKERGKGTGLGLSTVFGIVQQAGGSIAVSSRKGAGSTFRVYLPRVDAALDCAPTSIAPAGLGGDETILLVEDEDQVRAAARGILARHGYRVLEARDGAEALRVFEDSDEAIHLVLSDVVMPHMSGPELAERASILRPSAAFLCMSGHTDEDVVGAEALGKTVPYLQKPFTPSALARKVREVLDARAPELSASGVHTRPLTATRSASAAGARS